MQKQVELPMMKDDELTSVLKIAAADHQNPQLTGLPSWRVPVPRPRILFLLIAGI